MIIVSKDEKSIINFDNIEKIRIINNDKQEQLINGSRELSSLVEMTEAILGTKLTGSKDFGIYVYFKGETNIMLGDYDAEEKCKEILKEIIDYYCSGKKVYYMPEE